MPARRTRGHARAHGASPVHSLHVAPANARAARPGPTWTTDAPFRETRAEIAQALEDYQRGRLGVIPPGALMPHVARAPRQGDA